jgi:hypothetical protein
MWIERRSGSRVLIRYNCVVTENGREIYLGPKLELDHMSSLSLKIIRLKF